MAHGIPFHGMNDTIAPPPGDEGTIAPLALFRSPGGANVSCHELDDAELETVTRTGRVFLASFSGRTFFPVFVGSEATVRAIVADTGPTFERTPDDELPPSRTAIRFNLAPAVIALASAQGAGIELEVDGPSNIKAHVVAGDVGGNVPIAMPIALETVIATVLAVRELVDADDRNTSSSCGVRDQLCELEQWLDGHGVDVDARCYPQRSESTKAFLDMMVYGTSITHDGFRVDPRDFHIDPRKHEAAPSSGHAMAEREQGDPSDWLWQAVAAEIATWPRGFDPESDARPANDDYSSYRGDMIARAVLRALTTTPPTTNDAIAADTKTAPG